MHAFAATARLQWCGPEARSCYSSPVADAVVQIAVRLESSAKKCRENNGLRGLRMRIPLSPPKHEPK